MSATKDENGTTQPGEITRARMEVVVAEWRDADRRIAEGKLALETAYADERRLGRELAKLEDTFPVEIGEDGYQKDVTDG